MIDKSKIGISVGIFVFFALCIVTLFIFLISNFEIIRSGYYVKIGFGFANGVKVGAPVRFAGVDVGEVRRMHTYYDPQLNKTRVEILAWVKKSVKIPADSQVWINTLGLLGEKYIEILPGDNYAFSLKSGDHLIGQDPVSMQEITELGRKIAFKLDEGIESLNKIIKDEDLKTSLRQTLNDLRNITSQIKSGEGTIGRLIYDKTVYNDVEELMGDLKRNPWKLFWKTKEKKTPLKPQPAKTRPAEETKPVEKAPQAEENAAAVPEPAPAANFGP